MPRAISSERTWLKSPQETCLDLLHGEGGPIDLRRQLHPDLALRLRQWIIGRLIVQTQDLPAVCELVMDARRQPLDLPDRLDAPLDDLGAETRQRFIPDLQLTRIAAAVAQRLEQGIALAEGLAIISQHRRHRPGRPAIAPG